jgi:hypothetical protein
MRTVKRNPILSGVCAVLGGVFLWAGTAVADVTSDEAAAILVYPKLRVDLAAGIDTLIQLSNTSEEVVNVMCFYVNANSHCSNRPEQICNTNDDCVLGGICFEGWIETDFRFTLTPRQPVVWKLSQGMPFFPLDGIDKVGVGGTFNEDSAVPPAPENPFYGELKCVQVGDDGAPVDRNDLKGEATIVTANDTLLDSRGYNAVGIQAIEGANNGDKTLNIGEEYNDCPNILILDHFFDDAVEPINDNIVRSDLTLVPCTQDFANQETFNITVQFLVFNEFEQRFSTSTPIRCFKELALSDIDTRDRGFNDNDPASTSDLRSIFNANVQGTLTGQTRIRGVEPNPETDPLAESRGGGLIGVAEEFHRAVVGDLSSVVSSAAFNIHQSGLRERPNFITLP